MKEYFVTITGFKHYYGLQPFKIGNLIRCQKEPDCPFDGEDDDDSADQDDQD